MHRARAACDHYHYRHYLLRLEKAICFIPPCGIARNSKKNKTVHSTFNLLNVITFFLE